MRVQRTYRVTVRFTVTSGVITEKYGRSATVRASSEERATAAYTSTLHARYYPGVVTIDQTTTTVV